MTPGVPRVVPGRGGATRDRRQAEAGEQASERTVPGTRHSAALSVAFHGRKPGVADAFLKGVASLGEDPGPRY